MELAESLQKECLLLVVGEGESLDGLGGVSGTLLDGLGRDVSTGGTPLVLGDGGGLMEGFMGNVELVNLSESLFFLGLCLLDAETVLGALGRLVMHTSKVQMIVVEALISCFSSLLLDLEGRMTFGQ